MCHQPYNSNLYNSLYFRTRTTTLVSKKGQNGHFKNTLFAKSHISDLGLIIWWRVRCVRALICNACCLLLVCVGVCIVCVGVCIVCVHVCIVCVQVCVLCVCARLYCLCAHVGEPV